MDHQMMAEAAAQQGAIDPRRQRLDAHSGVFARRSRVQFELARSGRAACSCLLVRTHLRFSAAQAAKRSTKSSKPKQGQRRPISK